MQKSKYKELTFLQFQDRFSDEDKCIEHLIHHRWPEGFKCARCPDSTGSCFKPSKGAFECYSCKSITSPTSGTIFHRTKVPLRKWFWCIYLLSTPKKSVSTLYLSKQLELNYRTAWSMRRKLQKAMSSRDDLYVLENTVEVDEIIVGGRRNRSGGLASRNKSSFLFAVQEDRIGNPVFASAVKLDCSIANQFVPEILKKVKKRATLKSDGKSSYRWTVWEGGHTLEQSSGNQQKEVTHQHLKWVNMLASNLKRYLLSTHHGVFKDHCADYVAEFFYRFNRRFWPAQAFDRLLSTAIWKQPTPLRNSCA